jgi:hypothetical protein
VSSPVARWQPPFFESLKLAWRPLLVYLVFTLLGFVALFGTIASYERGTGTKLFELFVALSAGIAGIVAGQAVALLRFRTLPVLLFGGLSVAAGIYVLVVARADLPDVVGLALFFFCFAFPSGMLALHHRFELLGLFWPAVGWIGSVMVILNEEGRVDEWSANKVSAWLPLPLFFLFCFVVGLLIFMAQKQAMRVSLWQALSGATERRVQKKTAVSAIPRKNLLLGAAVILFAFTAVLAPYLWRTGKGDHGENQGKPDSGEMQERRTGEPRKGPSIDGEAIAKAVASAASSAKTALHTLWPLLILALFYRPAKRALLTSHLVTPIFPTPPSERIDNLWEYVRIAAEDAGTVPQASDAVEDFVARAKKSGRATAALDEAARIYTRTRYGFVVAPGDGLSMRKVAVPAARALRSGMTGWERIKSYWRPLS